MREMETSSPPEIIPPKSSNSIPSLEIATGESCWTQFLDQVENGSFWFYFRKYKLKKKEIMKRQMIINILQILLYYNQSINERKSILLINKKQNNNHHFDKRRNHLHQCIHHQINKFHQFRKLHI